MQFSQNCLTGYDVTYVIVRADVKDFRLHLTKQNKINYKKKMKQNRTKQDKTGQNTCYMMVKFV